MIVKDTVQSFTPLGSSLNLENVDPLVADLNLVSCGGIADSVGGV